MVDQDKSRPIVANLEDVMAQVKDLVWDYHNQLGNVVDEKHKVNSKKIAKILDRLSYEELKKFKDLAIERFHAEKDDWIGRRYQSMYFHAANAQKRKKDFSRPTLFDEINYAMPTERERIRQIIYSPEREAITLGTYRNHFDRFAGYDIPRSVKKWMIGLADSNVFEKYRPPEHLTAIFDNHEGDRQSGLKSLAFRDVIDEIKKELATQYVNEIFEKHKLKDSR